VQLVRSADGAWSVLISAYKGFEAVQAKVEKMRYGGLDPEVAKLWLSYGFKLSEADGWLELGSTPEEAVEWKILSDEYVMEFGELYNWHDSGFSVEDVYEWAGWPNSFSLDDAEEWRGAGFSCEEATVWRKARFDPDDAKEWRDAGFSCEEAVAFVNAGVTPEEAEQQGAGAPHVRRDAPTGEAAGE
jgi:hypothetical protein